MALTREQVIDAFAEFTGQSGGLDSWIGAHTPIDVVNRLCEIDEQPLTHSQLNQLLLLSHEASMSKGFFDYYWTLQEGHPYNIKAVQGYSENWLSGTTLRPDRGAPPGTEILSFAHLVWGMKRFYTDALLYFGSVRTAYRFLRKMSLQELQDFYDAKKFRPEIMAKRGPAIAPGTIKDEWRYLISEMASNLIGVDPDDADAAFTAQLVDLYATFEKAEGAGKASISAFRKAINEGELTSENPEKASYMQFVLSAFDNDQPASTDDVEGIASDIKSHYFEARNVALQNTRIYLSFVNDLDVYVATSMRAYEHFLNMATACREIFDSPDLSNLQLRYFDPTLSAATNPHDKGLIECLMVKCSKALVYVSGEADSYGKDAEAAMSLSLGKPVIFFQPNKKKAQFWREVHPLARLIDFQTGVAVGAIVATTTKEVAKILQRVFNNGMEYDIERSEGGSLVLRERLTGSVVRLQTSDTMIRETFWNHYHEAPSSLAEPRQLPH